MSESGPTEHGLSTSAQADALFGRVAAILDQARGNVVRAVNTQMVWAYWLIGREMGPLQGGRERADLPIPHPLGGVSSGIEVLPSTGRKLKPRSQSAPISTPESQGFSPQTTWSHYRCLMRVKQMAMPMNVPAGAKP